MITSKSFGLILMLIGGFLLLLSGGCVVLGAFLLGASIFHGQSSNVGPAATLTLFCLVVGWIWTRKGYHMLTGKKDEPPEDLISSTDKDPQEFLEKDTKV